ncbi:hypothetical protein C2W62_46700 [Candidatus Entotheonella serta]|nr:hypothetical protein C2W62_46700 [Candidatus Entotheonella serta]
MTYSSTCILARRRGHAAQGVWTLTVRDRGAMEVGQLINWELNITPPGDAGDP